MFSTSQCRHRGFAVCGWTMPTVSFQKLEAGGQWTPTKHSGLYHDKLARTLKGVTVQETNWWWMMKREWRELVRTQTTPKLFLQGSYQSATWFCRSWGHPIAKGLSTSVGHCMSILTTGAHLLLTKMFQKRNTLFSAQWGTLLFLFFLKCALQSRTPYTWLWWYIYNCGCDNWCWSDFEWYKGCAERWKTSSLKSKAHQQTRSSCDHQKLNQSMYDRQEVKSTPEYNRFKKRLNQTFLINELCILVKSHRTKYWRQTWLVIPL